MQYYIKKMMKSSNADISGDKRALQKLRKEVERAKRALSTQQQVRLDIDDLAPGYDFSETLTRARFEELNNDLFNKTLGSVSKVLEDADFDKSEVDEIVLVGIATVANLLLFVFSMSLYVSQLSLLVSKSVLDSPITFCSCASCEKPIDVDW